VVSLDNVAAVSDVCGECSEESAVAISLFLLISWLLLPCEFDEDDDDVDGLESPVTWAKITKNN
jgi:hypothetical protein